jgi:hypothetical protein
MNASQDIKRFIITKCNMIPSKGIRRLGIGRIGRFQYSNNFQHKLASQYIYFYVRWKLPI